MTPNEIRRTLGMDPYPPEQEWANWPLPVLMLALQGKAIGELIGRPDQGPQTTEQDPPEDDEDGDEDDDSNDDEDDDESSDEDSDDDSDSDDSSDDSTEERSKDPMAMARRAAAAVRTLPAGRSLGNLEPELTT